MSQAKRELDSTFKDVSGRIERAIEADLVPREQVKDWLATSEQKVKEVDSLLQRGEKRKQSYVWEVFVPRIVGPAIMWAKKLLK